MLCGLAPTVVILVGARILQAVAAAALVPASLALVLQTFPHHKIPVAVAIWGAVGAVAGAAGPTLGALVIENLGWRWAFYINLPVGIISFLLGRRVLPEWREANPGRLPDPAGVGLLAAGLALAAFGIVQTDDWGWGSTRVRRVRGRRRRADRAVRAAMRQGAPTRCSTSPCSSRSRSAGPTRRCWSSPIGFSAMFLGNVLFLTGVWHYSILRAGMAISVGPLIVAVDRSVVRQAGRPRRPAPTADPRRVDLGTQWRAVDQQGHAGPRLRQPLPAVGDPQRPRRRAVPAAALVGRGAGPAAAPVRVGLGRQSGGAQPRGNARRRRSSGVHGRARHRRQRSTRSTTCGGCWSSAASRVSILATRLPRQGERREPTHAVVLEEALA